MKLNKKNSIFWLIITLLLLPGIIVSVMRCVFRSVAEQPNIYVETVVDLDEFRQLAREDGWSLEDLFERFKANGVSSVSISEDTLASLELEGKITVLSTKEIRKLSLEETYDINLPVSETALAGLWVHSDDDKLLDRITQNLSWKLPERALVRVHRNLLHLFSQLFLQPRTELDVFHVANDNSVYENPYTLSYLSVFTSFS